MSIDELIRLADQYRDARRFLEAAEAYSTVLKVQPGRADLWVQYGNMLKDSDQLEAAERAYLQAIAAGGDTADTQVQLGRVYRLAGRREEALAAFANALKRNNACRDAIAELVSLGDTWRVQERIGLSALPLANLAAAVRDIRDTLQRLEAALPLAESLASIPIERYDLFRKLYKVPPPPDPGSGESHKQRIGVAVIAPAGALALTEVCLASLLLDENGATPPNVPSRSAPDRITILAFDADVQVALARRQYATPERYAVCSSLTFRAALEALVDVDWIVLSREPVLFDPQAFAWWRHSSRVVPTAIAFLCDEDTARAPNGGERYRTQPWFKGALDAELLGQGFDPGTVVIARREFLERAINGLEAGQTPTPPFTNGSDVDAQWLALLRSLESLGPVGHTPQVLISRFEELGWTTAPRRLGSEIALQLSPGCGADSVRPPSGTILVIIPTKDRVDLLKACVTSLRDKATTAAFISVCIVDNDSRDPATLDFLSGGARTGLLDVLSCREPFNWARFNNLAAERAREEILVFANNDLEMISTGWDDRVRSLLSRPEVGAVGARLIYPDKTLQHAGIVHGTVNGSEHEGRGEPMDAPGPYGRFQTRHCVAAVTGAFLACRRQDFMALGGFDAETLPVWFNDSDFCLRVDAQGLRVLYEPAILAIHHESKTLSSEFQPAARDAQFLAARDRFATRWGDKARSDRWFNPTYARWGTPFRYLNAPSTAASVLLR